MSNISDFTVNIYFPGTKTIILTIISHMSAQVLKPHAALFSNAVSGKLMLSFQKAPISRTSSKSTVTTRQSSPLPCLENPEEKETTSPREAALQRLNSFTVATHKDDIEVCLREREALHPAANCLKNHSISSRLRSSMINWMVEVLGTFECNDQTFFLSIALMDRYYAVHKSVRDPEDIHLTGIVSMFLASKNCEKYPLNMHILQDKIGHNSFETEEIVAKEVEILSSLSFDVMLTTVFDFLENETVYLQTVKYDAVKTANILNTGIVLAKMASYDYKMLNYKPSYLAAFILSAAILKEFNKGNTDSVLINWVRDLATKNGMTIEELDEGSKLIRTLDNTFSDKYGEDNNIFRFDSHRMNLLA